MEFNKEEFKNFAQKIFACDSPSGFTHHAIKEIEEMVKKLGYNYKITNKGTLVVSIRNKDAKKNIALASHLDTLGLMVRSINKDGTLKLTKIGGPCTPTLDGEYAKVYTRDGKIYEGTILSISPSVHVYEDASTLNRDIDHLLFRLDEKVLNDKDVRELGIDNGDFICYDPKFKITDSEFLKSRFIDDKASVCILLTILKEAKNTGYVFKNNVDFYFTAYEEVGHGASSLLEPVDEFLVVDMGCVGKDLAGNEYAVSICAKDSSGPFDYELTTKLINLAKTNKLNYTVDIFPMYGSDIRSARDSGNDFKGALIGPGVHASHGAERTHFEALKNTFELINLYLDC